MTCSQHTQSITFSDFINERHEGNKLFLGNHKYRTFLWLTGDGIVNYEKLKADIAFAHSLEKEDPELFYALHRCRIIEGDVSTKEASTKKQNELRQLGGYRISAGSSFAPFRVIWEVTRRCNLKCRYCHSPASDVRKVSKKEEYELPLDSLLAIADRLIDAKVFEVTLSGGECLLRGEELFVLINYLRSNKIAVNIISNGLLMTKSVVQRLKDNDVSVAISLDTYTEEDQLITRGEGTFSKAIKAIRLLLSYGVRVNIACTLTRFNFDSLDRFIEFCVGLGVKTVILQNLIPGSDLSIYEHLKLTNEQENKLPDLLPKLLKKYRETYIQTTEVDFFSHLFYDKNSFDEGEYLPNPNNNLMSNSCSACHTGGFIDYRGDLYPCTSFRMTPMGSLLETDLLSLWLLSKNAKFVRSIRSKTTHDLPDCVECEFVSKCSGGCRGEAFSLTGNWYALHDRCPIKRQKGEIRE